MAAFSAIAMGVVAAVSVGSSVAQGVQARNDRKKAQSALDNYERQDLENTTFRRSVPTMGANLAREEAIRTQAEMAHLAARGSNVSGIAAGGGISQHTTRSMQEISAQLQEAEFRLQNMMAEDQQRIQGMQENRENMDIQGLGAQIAGARERESAAWDRGISTVSSMASLASSMKGDSPRDLDGNTARDVRRLERVKGRQDRRTMRLDSKISDK